MIWLCGRMSQNQAFGSVSDRSVSCLLVLQGVLTSGILCSNFLLVVVMIFS